MCFSVCYFSLSFVVVVVVAVVVVVVVVSKKEELNEYKSLENLGHHRILERQVRLYRDISKSFFKLWFSIVFLMCVEEKHSRCNTGEQFRFILIFLLLFKA